MELQLGLALPSNIVFGFDLNSYVYKPKEISGSGQLNHHQAMFSSCFSKASSTCSDDCSSSSKNEQNKNKKRSASVAFDEITRDDLPQTLPLLLWNNHPNDNEDDDVNEHSFSFASDKIEEDSDDGIVGWPPIKYRYRRKKIRTVQNNRTVDNGCADCRGKPSNYVKVKMDGVAIARKIDLSLHNSFQSLKETLLPMFGISQENSTGYKLTYQDREGDWLLADDISWRSFVGSVQRLKLMKNNNSGLYN